jgi:5-methylcytosine-specific restriction endonuclease McrA
MMKSGRRGERQSGATKSALRMPGVELQRQLVARDGYHCRFCGIPVVPVQVRKKLAAAYHEALPWGETNASQHAAFQVLWLQYDHIVPHARGGDNSLHNLIIACAGCNYSRMNWTLEEVGLQDPREREPVSSMWDGLTRLL